MNDKRAQFFLAAALVCVALVPLADARFRNLTLAVAGTYALLALALVPRPPRPSLARFEAPGRARLRSPRPQNDYDARGAPHG